MKLSLITIMEMKKFVCVCFLLITVLSFECQVVNSSEYTNGGNGLSSNDPEAVVRKPSINCNKECNRRCKVATPKDRCLKYCSICCQTCHCVPSGTWGHKDECPCYRDKKNSKGKPKCP